MGGISLTPHWHFHSLHRHYDISQARVVSDESKSVEIFCKYFVNIVQNIEIDGLASVSSDIDAVTIRKATGNYQNHPSIKVIREYRRTSPAASLLTYSECFSKVISDWDTSKAIQRGDIPK